MKSDNTKVREEISATKGDEQPVVRELTTAEMLLVSGGRGGVSGSSGGGGGWGG